MAFHRFFSCFVFSAKRLSVTILISDSITKPSASQTLDYRSPKNLSTAVNRGRFYNGSCYLSLLGRIMEESGRESENRQRCWFHFLKGSKSVKKKEKRHDEQDNYPNIRFYFFFNEWCVLKEVENSSSNHPDT